MRDRAGGPRVVRLTIANQSIFGVDLDHNGVAFDSATNTKLNGRILG